MYKKGLFGKLLIVAIIVIFFLIGTGIYIKNGSKGEKAVQGIGRIVEDLNFTDKILNQTGILDDSNVNKSKNESDDEEIDVSKVDKSANDSDFNNIAASNITLNYTKLSP